MSTITQPEIDKLLDIASNIDNCMSYLGGKDVNVGGGGGGEDLKRFKAMLRNELDEYKFTSTQIYIALVREFNKNMSEKDATIFLQDSGIL